ncbi:TetR/AcrR family transcriptional regulator [Nocardioides sp. zg-1228]|uniref:TetR/AcrR family transcriptional regulator n=1 Tax=Nocardioides sp. zg-1228 TaxID=2763008 RepID=UPI001642AFC3|nr:TetR/AcrR family transcriptional regulator [Nocardioides sp. zg-1228]MBC2932355.1 WHG domain-containing protein [Nocardioides sp. zg-1228]QSF57869.1 WHG domain-containing protein [Nocardioides sp. zg-1228]
MPRAGLTSGRVTEAAAELADEVGLDRVTLAALAQRFGIATPSLYTHVRSADDVRVRVALLALEETADAVAAALAGVGGRSALVALGGVWRDYARAHPGRYAATRLPLDAEAAAASAGPRHAELTRSALRGYALSAADETHAVRLLGATFHGYAALDAAGAFGHGGASAPTSDDTWERVLDGLDTLLRSWEAR